MNQCLKITIQLDNAEEQLLKIIQSHAQALRLEGTVQCSYEPMIIKMYVCGIQSLIDEFIDKIHYAIANHSSKNVIMEPFIRQKDYRGVFRIIE